MKFSGICLITRDVPSLADFYARVLSVQAEGNATHVELNTQGTHMTIFSIAGMERMAPQSMLGAGYGSVIIAFEVVDVDQAYERLAGQGVEIIMPPTSHPWGARSFWFRDPDGNIVDFFAAIQGFSAGNQ
ncbi:MAG TPA: VOC family protein [Anaerolineales bacterium]|nr:VOC family protein [Anaerolineales bacterium]